MAHHGSPLGGSALGFAAQRGIGPFTLIGLCWLVVSPHGALAGPAEAGGGQSTEEVGHGEASEAATRKDPKILLVPSDDPVGSAAVILGLDAAALELTRRGVDVTTVHDRSCPPGPACPLEVAGDAALVATVRQVDEGHGREVLATMWHVATRSVARRRLAAVDGTPLDRAVEASVLALFPEGLGTTEEELAGMVRIPGARFFVGVPDPRQGDPDEHPGHEVELTTFWMDRTEVTVADYQVCVALGRCREPGLPLAMAERCTWGRDPGLPISCVTWYQADTFCRSLGKVLPSEARWEYAAKGPAAMVYPWDGRWPPPLGGPNLADRSASAALPGWPVLDGYHDGSSAAGPAGSFPKDRSPFGVLDLGGNLAEWVLDCYDPKAYGSMVKTNPFILSDECQARVVRGGSWRQMDPWYLRATNRRHAAPDVADPAVGFRCAARERLGQGAGSSGRAR